MPLVCHSPEITWTKKKKKELLLVSVPRDLVSEDLGYRDFPSFITFNYWRDERASDASSLSVNAYAIIILR
jgi:hypothetical protein